MRGQLLSVKKGKLYCLYASLTKVNHYIFTAVYKNPKLSHTKTRSI